MERYSYTVFGEPNRTSSVGNPYLFTGREYDSETGNYYYRARYYSPKIGRFLQTDPIGYADSMNLYTYVGNNPINWIDPYGEDIWVENDPTISYGLGFHYRICVGKLNGYFEGYSFGLDSNWHILIPYRKGTIYRDWAAELEGHRGKITKCLSTTPEQDKFARDVLRSMEDERMDYGAWNACGTFSNVMFDYFKELFEGK